LKHGVYNLWLSLRRHYIAAFKNYQRNNGACISTTRNHGSSCCVLISAVLYQYYHRYQSCLTVYYPFHKPGGMQMDAE